MPQSLPEHSNEQVQHEHIGKDEIDSQEYRSDPSNLGATRKHPRWVDGSVGRTFDFSCNNGSEILSFNVFYYHVYD